MPEPSWIFFLAMATFAVAIGFAIASMLRARRDRKNHTESAADREKVVRAREERIEPQPKR
ncbi:MAG: hypothetical protein ABL307_14965 [Roseitalea porphyridii]|uniref:Uncharacterized protein n=1 Tax=Roseitalea porphyridii TaxID=1852022 RepID=A0A4P6UYC5_9HYPH|nr:hypothetical protein [Roseitalea porphyridii]QBK29483.1 hypothetical protein E0E05_02045 [Roseitalea porphyridii]